MEYNKYYRFVGILLVAGLSQVHAQCANVVEYVNRTSWEARDPVDQADLILPVNMTFIHHTATERCTDRASCITQVQYIQDLHMDNNGYDDIGYSFLVGEDGRVYEGRGWETFCNHIPAYDEFSHGIAIIGDYRDKDPAMEAQDATQAWLQCGVDLGYITDDYELFGHSDGHCTECPGKHVFNIIQSWPHYSYRDIPEVC